MPVNNNILLAFYGDDLTGSTDALEFICKAGARAMLFIEPPDAAALNKFPGLDVIGIAGKTRALPVNEMEPVLSEAFQKMKAYKARHIHYKVCSTFDSSSQIGSIGKVIDLGMQAFNHDLLPVIGGTPSLGRHCVFGNLFARMGIGSDGIIHRLDRHPSMSRHPVTPADESDLRLHLQKQTDQPVGLIDVLQLEQPIALWDKAAKDKKVVLVDALYEAQLTKIGAWLDERLAKQKDPLFSIGSSAVEMALGNYWNQENRIAPKADWPHPGKAAPLLVISGSCSPVTAAQIAWAKTNGFEEIVIDALAICNGEADMAVSQKVSSLAGQHKNVIVHTGTRNSGNLPSQHLGTALGKIARYAVENNHHLKRVVVAGGDTSSYAARTMEVEAVEMIASLVSGAPLCKALSKNKAINGLEVNFKGGQVGAENYFGILRNGELRNE